MIKSKKSFIKKFRRPVERSIQRFCLDLLTPENHYGVNKFGKVIKNTNGKWQVWRNNTGALRTESGGFMRAGFPGTPDIIGVAIDGKFIAIECKRDDKAKTNAAQDAFADCSRAGYYFRVDSVESAVAARKRLLEIYGNYITLAV